MGESDTIEVHRTRLVVVGRGSIKCDLEDARRVAAGVDPSRVYVERSSVALLDDGTEVLGPWLRDDGAVSP
jgi:hypothetical protein